MKKKIFLFVTFIALILVGCGQNNSSLESEIESEEVAEEKEVVESEKIAENEEKEASYYYGKWQAIKLEVDEVTYAVEELEAAENYNMTDFYIILNAEGKCYFHYKDGESTGDWIVTSTGIQTGSNTMILADDELLFTNQNETVHFVKVSEEQSFPEVSDEQTMDSSNSEIRPEIKEALDSYEAFFNEYVEFMNKYKNSTDVVSMLNDYQSYMTQYMDMMSKFEAMKDSDMNDAELAYYMEVSLRISQTLLNVAQ